MNNTLKDLPYRPCVGAALFNQKGLVWVGKRLIKPNTKLKPIWQLPQGGIEEGESADCAVLRELKEETGINQVEIICESKRWIKYDLPIGLIGNIWGGLYRGQRQKWFALKFLGTDVNVDLNTHEQPEFSDWKWLTLRTIPLIAAPFKKKVYQAVAKEFRNIVRESKKLDLDIV